MARCDYCRSGNVKQILYGNIEVRRVIKVKVSPPPGARDLNIFENKLLEENFHGSTFRVCQNCGAIWELSVVYDSGRDQHNWHATTPEHYNDFVKRWKEMSSKPGARILGYAGIMK